jgi:hypothetical protein
LCTSINVKAGEALKGIGFCSEVESLINRVADFTDTKCLPGASPRKGFLDLLIISEQPVFATQRAKNVWLLVAVATVGKEARENPDIALDEIALSDVSLLKHRKYFMFPASEAPKLQRQVHDGTMTANQAFARISALLKQKIYIPTIQR